MRASLIARSSSRAGRVLITDTSFGHYHRVSTSQVDTPLDMAASKRFARYRGLKSWRTSSWDPKEELPPDYAKVFAFENFKRAHRRFVTHVMALLRNMLKRKAKARGGQCAGYAALSGGANRVIFSTLLHTGSGSPGTYMNYSMTQPRRRVMSNGRRSLSVYLTK